MTLILNINKPVGNFVPSKLTYLVFNHHYKAYRKKKHKGRNMIVWTEPHLIDMTSLDEDFTTFTIRKTS